MSVELYIGNIDGTKVYQPAVQEGIEWSTERSGTPGKLTFKVMKDGAAMTLFNENSEQR